MKWTSALTACLALSACSGGGREQAPSVPVAQTPETFLGLKIGAKADLPDCSRYSDDGDYKVPSLQEVTPCITRSLGRVIAVDGVPVPNDAAAAERVAILFGVSQVPPGISTTARATLHGGSLAKITLNVLDDASSAQQQAISNMLIEKYGSPMSASDSAQVWGLSDMMVVMYPPERGSTAEVIATSRAYLEWERGQSAGRGATSF